MVQADSAGAAKKAKAAPKAPVDDARLAALAAEGKLSKLTVAELKAAIEAKGHKPAGKRKADHVEQLEQILNP